jgi:hypothetical protein
MAIWHRIVEAGRQGFRNLTRKPELRVWHHRDRQGTLHWHAYNPTTGQSFSAASEAEMRIWVEKQYLYQCSKP